MHGAIVYSACCNPHDTKCDAVHDHGHTRHHKGHDTVCKQLCACKLTVSLIKPLFLLLLTAESPDNGKTCKNLTRNKVYLVYKTLHNLELWHRNANQCENKNHDGSNRNGNHPLHAGFGLCHLDDTTDTNDWRVKHHTKHHSSNHLNLLYIIRASSNQ